MSIQTRQFAISGENGTRVSFDEKNTGVWQALWPALMLAIIALLLRWPYIGDPDLHLDEQFYLLVGDRMWQGALPYVDIWDRKPIGLFLIYAMARLLGGDGVIAYQLLACAFAVGTAYNLRLIALRWSHSIAATIIAVLYLCWLPVYGGMGGQSPVFYNFLTALAALLTIKSNDKSKPEDVFHLGIIVMLLCGLTLQIKYTAVMEGIFFGIYLLWRSRNLSATPVQLLINGLIYCFLALLPTILATAYYTKIGHLEEFIHANFISVFERHSMPQHVLNSFLYYILLAALPLLPSTTVGFLKQWKTAMSPPSDLLFLLGWLTSAFFGFVMIGNFYDHYALPLLLPMTILTASLFEHAIIGVTIFTILMGWPLLVIAKPNFSTTAKSRANIHLLTERARPYLKNRCLFIYDGPSILYLTTNACIPTRFAYPDHLSNAVEADAIQTNSVAEIRRILAQQPGAIITSSAPVIPEVNKETRSIINESVKKDYVQIVAVKERGGRYYQLNVLRSLIHDRE